MKATLVIVVSEVASQSRVQDRHRLMPVEVDFLVLHRSPQPFHEHVVEPAAFADFEGKSPTEVEIAVVASGSVQVRWDHDGIPSQKVYDSPEIKAASWPGVPAMTRAAGDLVRTLADASDSATDTAVRYALNHIQIRGGTGEVVANDGHHGKRPCDKRLWHSQ